MASQHLHPLHILKYISKSFLYWTGICMRNILYIYLFKDLDSESVGLRDSPLFLFLLFLCHFWQLVVDSAVTNWKRNSGAGIWCQKPGGSWAMPTDRQALLLSSTKAGRENQDPLITCPHALSLFTPTIQRWFVKRFTGSDSVFFSSLTPPAKKKTTHTGQPSFHQVPFLIRKRRNKVFHCTVICTPEIQRIHPICTECCFVFVHNATTMRGRYDKQAWWIVHKKNGLKENERE